MESTKILFIAQEITPYLPESEIANVCRFLPQAIQEKGKEIRTFMPRYGCVNERRNQLHEVIRLSGMNLIIDDSDHPLIIKVASIQSARMQVYFIDNDDFFQRKCTFSDENGEYEDNEDRAIFFVRGVLETVKKLRWTPDIIHCHGWISSLIPLYVKKAFNTDPFFKNSKIVYSVYSDDFKKPFSRRFAEKVKIDGVEDEHIDSIRDKHVSFTDLTKFAIEYCDAVIQGSSEVAEGVIEHAKKKGVPFLSYQSPENYVDVYNEFYDSILNS
ncbi:MAG: glycogen/starch synthase [Prevotellaceae bacterium]|jgi:starch synthase|nr:glycogen/starch synthase [Prevotellaceae bacterium]